MSSTSVAGSGTSNEPPEAEHGVGEQTPLLRNGASQDDRKPDKSLRRTILSLCWIFLLILEVGAYLQTPPLQQIMEDVICHEYYPDHAVGTSLDERCKNNPLVAGKLAMIRGWQNAFDCVPPLLASLPYGIMADKYGRRPVLALSIFGITLEVMWQTLPLLWPNIFPIWVMWLGTLFQFIGGGIGVLQAMLWTMIADVVPADERTAKFFQLAAVVLVGELFTAPLSAFLMSKNPWIPISIGIGLFTCGTTLAAFIPETLTIQRARDEEIEHQLPRDTISQDVHGGSYSKGTVWRQIVMSMKNDMNHVWNFLLGSGSIMALILSFNIGALVRYAKGDMLLQYTHERFGWKWETATLLGTVGSLTNLAMLLAILPGLSWLITNRARKSPAIRDLWLTRLTGVLMVIGCFFLAFSFTSWMMIIALILFSMGTSFTTLLRAVLNNLIEPHTIGVLNTTISVVEMVVILISAPTMSALLKRGIAAGGAWIGLPFMVATALAAFGALIPFVYRFPDEFYQPIPSE